MSTGMPIIFAAGLVGLACSSCGAKSDAGAGSAASGGQAGSTITGVATGGSGGTGSPIGNGGSGGTGGQIGMVSSPPLPIFFPFCNPGDQQVASGVGASFVGNIDLSGECPAGRECYSVSGESGPILCMLPEGVHCTDPLSCNPGDTPMMAGDAGLGDQHSSYKVRLCNQVILCSSSEDAGECPVVCSGVWLAGDALERLDASTDGGEPGTTACCGNGIAEPGEYCDLGCLNDVPARVSASWSWTADPNGIVWCTSSCRNAQPLCQPSPGGMICD
jgi:hypothetical protein